MIKPNPLIFRLKNVGMLLGGVALDVGAGVGNDSFFLSQNGYDVIALDLNTSLIEMRKESLASPVEVQNADIVMYEMQPKSYELINANNVLPFVSQDDFEETFTKIARSLKTDGVFCFSLFGTEDAWANRASMSFHTYDEGLEMVADNHLEVVFEQTEKGLGTTMKGDVKYWQIHRFIVKK